MTQTLLEDAGYTVCRPSHGSFPGIYIALHFNLRGRHPHPACLGLQAPPLPQGWTPRGSQAWTGEHLDSWPAAGLNTSCCLALLPGFCAPRTETSQWFYCVPRTETSKWSYCVPRTETQSGSTVHPGQRPQSDPTVSPRQSIHSGPTVRLGQRFHSGPAMYPGQRSQSGPTVCPESHKAPLKPAQNHNTNFTFVWCVICAHTYPRFNLL